MKSNAKSRKTLSLVSKAVIIFGAVVMTGILLAAVISLMMPAKSINSFQDCKDAGGAIMESYPEQCAIDGRTFVNTAQSNVGGYVGLSEQEALDKAKAENKPARVVERDGEGLIITMDFNPDRLNLYVKDDHVYKVVVEGGQ